jgi:hypothetical protein
MLPVAISLPAVSPPLQHPVRAIFVETAGIVVIVAVVMPATTRLARHGEQRWRGEDNMESKGGERRIWRWRAREVEGEGGGREGTQWWKGRGNVVVYTVAAYHGSELSLLR